MHPLFHFLYPLTILNLQISSRTTPSPWFTITCPRDFVCLKHVTFNSVEAQAQGYILYADTSRNTNSIPTVEHKKVIQQKV